MTLPPRLEEYRADLGSELAGYTQTKDPDAVEEVGMRGRDAGPGRSASAGAAPDAQPPDAHRVRDGFTARGWFDRKSAATPRAALSPLTAPAPPTVPCDGICVVPGIELPDLPESFGGPLAGSAVSSRCDRHDAAERGPRPGVERMADCMVELARRTVATGSLPVDAYQPPQVTVTVPLEVLESRSGAGLLSFGDGTLSAAIDAETARRLACDARVVPIVLASTGEPLDVGREVRLANRAQRRALAQRDGGCAFPGCDCPPQWCVAHHVIHWADGGRTDLANLVLLCSRHHTVIHTQEWVITMNGGFPLFHPPPWIPGGPRRNSVHRPDLVVHDLVSACVRQ